MKKRTVLVVIGPTGVGKTDFVERLFRESAIEIINGDMGQIYVPLTIGTAKPAWQQAPVPHHLFDILSEPVSFSAMKYRKSVTKLIEQIWKKGKLPVIVGGSSFYLLSLFFPPIESDASSEIKSFSDEKLWTCLQKIDSQRAQKIHPHDTYRIRRALDIWCATGIKPSSYLPTLNPFASCVLIWLDRDRTDLYDRIDKRVHAMMQAGWLEEAKELEKSEWSQFLRQKKIIGYDIMFVHLSGALTQEELYAKIQQKTRNYAKRQLTFWRSFKRKLKGAVDALKIPSNKPITIHELNLTHDNIESYIKQLKYNGI